MMSDWMKNARAGARELDQSTKKNSYKERLHLAGESARKNGLAPQPVQTAAKVQAVNTESKPVQMSKPANNYLLSDNLKAAGEQMKNDVNARLVTDGEFANTAVKNLRANGQTEAADNLKSQLDALERERHIAELREKQAAQSSQKIPAPKPVLPQYSNSYFVSPGVKEIGENLITRYNAQSMLDYMGSREYAHKQETARKRAQAEADAIYKEMQEYIANPNVNALDDPKILDYRNRYNAALMESTPSKTQEWETEQYLDILATGGESLMNVVKELAKERDHAYSRNPATSAGVDEANAYFNRYNQLKKKYGDVLDDWMAYADRVRNGEIAEDKLAAWTQFGRDKSDFRTWNTSVGIGLGSYGGYVDAWGQKLTNAITGKDYPIDYNTPAQMPAKISRAIRSGATEDKGGFGGFLYNSTASIADSAIPLAFGGPGKAILALSGATNYMQAAAERGVPDNQALLIGGVCGVADMAIEKLGFDRIFGAKSTGTLADDIIGIFNNAGLEALGEGATTLITTAADALIAGDKSEINTEIKNYMEQGYSYNEAVNLARKNWVNGLALDMAGGYFSGGVLSSGKVGFNAATGKYNTNRPVTISQQPSVQIPEQQVAKDLGDFGSKENAPVDQTETESTSVNTNPAIHTPQEQAIINEYQNAVDNSILSFVKRWKSLKDPNFKRKIRIRISAVTDRAVTDIKSKLGIDTSGYTHSLSGNGLEHIEKDHGMNGESDHSMADINDIARIGYVLENYDSVNVLLTKDGKVKTSREHRNKDNTHAPLIQFQKKVNGTYYVVEAVPDTTAQELKIVSAYMSKGGSIDQVSSVPKNDPRLTPETNHGANTPVTSVSKSIAPVNRKNMDLVPSRRTDTGTGLPQGDRTQDPSNVSIPNSDVSVNMEDLDELDEATFERMFLEGFEEDVNDGMDPILGINKNTDALLKQVAEDLNIKMEFVDSIWTKSGKEANGSLDSNGIMQISRNADKPVHTVAAHETTHRLKQLAPSAYEKFRDLAVQMDPMALDDVVQRYGDDAATLEMAKDEVAAELAEEIFRDENKLKQLIEEANKSQESRNAVQKFFAVLRDVIQKLRQTIQNLYSKGYSDSANQLTEQLSDMECAEQLWKEAYVMSRNAVSKDTIEDMTHENSELQTMYKLKDIEADSVKEQIRTHLSELDDMDPVADATVPIITGKQMSDVRKWIEDQLRSTGYRVDRKDFGVISFDEKLLNTSLNYISDPAEIAAYAVLPRVLKRGIEIGRHDDHKGRSYGTVTFAAPVILNGKIGNMAAVVKMTNKNGYKIHRILMPDGSAYELENIENAEPTPV